LTHSTKPNNLVPLALLLGQL